MRKLILLMACGALACSTKAVSAGDVAFEHRHLEADIPGRAELDRQIAAALRMRTRGGIITIDDRQLAGVELTGFERSLVEEAFPMTVREIKKQAWLRENRIEEPYCFGGLSFMR